MRLSVGRSGLEADLNPLTWIDFGSFMTFSSSVAWSEVELRGYRVPECPKDWWAWTVEESSNSDPFRFEEDEEGEVGTDWIGSGSWLTLKLKSEYETRGFEGEALEKARGFDIVEESLERKGLSWPSIWVDSKISTWWKKIWMRTLTKKGRVRRKRGRTWSVESQLSWSEQSDSLFRNSKLDNWQCRSKEGRGRRCRTFLLFLTSVSASALLAPASRHLDPF